ncbi:MAG: nucleotidyltransferase substrate binding protein [Clostridiales bacterium]|nr:nucleotidyltransferase substrate binding protein [Clostridiales bacterium]
MDEKFMKRYESFRNSLLSLTEAKDRDLSDSFVLSGTGAKFNITFDLAWKLMKDILIQRYAITNFITGSPREVLRASFKAELIEGDEWMEMLKIRNQMTHDYDGTILKEHCRTIVDVYIDKLWELERKAAEVTEGESD